MDLFSVLIAIAIATFVGYIFYERSRQQVVPRKKEKYYMNGREIEEAFEEIQSGIYGDTKTEDEFDIGLALTSLVDSIDNPDEYDDAALEFIHNYVDDQVAHFRLKYDEEIRMLNENKSNSGDGQ
jgi:hypothetical protein